MSNITTTPTFMCFPPISTYFLAFLSLVATPLHFLIIRVLIVRFRLALPRHKILLCLSISDNLQILGAGIVAFIGLGLQLTVTSQSCQVLRQIEEIIATQTHVASSGFIILLAIERYIACIHSLRFYTIVTPSRENFAVVSVWVISILSGLLALHPNQPNYSQLVLSKNVRTRLVYITTTLVSTVVLIFVQARLYRLSRTKLKVTPHNTFGEQKEKDDSTRRQLKLGFAASVVIILYVVCMLPLACLYVYLLLKPKEDLAKTKDALVILILANMFVDPFVYGFGMVDVRQGIKREARNLKKCICRE